MPKPIDKEAEAAKLIAAIEENQGILHLDLRLALDYSDQTLHNRKNMFRDLIFIQRRYVKDRFINAYYTKDYAEKNHLTGTFYENLPADKKTVSGKKAMARNKDDKDLSGDTIASRIAVSGQRMVDSLWHSPHIH